MKAARLHLVDEAKKDTAAGKSRSAAQGDEVDGATKVTSRRKLSRGSGVQSERVERSAAAPDSTPASRTRAGKRSSTVADLMRAPAVCCRLTDTLQRAAQLMWEHDVGAVVVLDEAGKARHLITDRDVCMGAYTQGVPLRASGVKSVLPAPLLTCSSETGVAEARRLMQEHGVRRIPVTDASGSVVGVIGLGDLVREARASAPKGRSRAISASQLVQTLAAVYEDTGVPSGRAARQQ